MEQTVKTVTGATVEYRNDGKVVITTGLGEGEILLDKVMNVRGRIRVEQNGNAVFKRSQRTYLSPDVHRISSGDNYTLRRTSRHYILQVKVPIVESRRDSEETMNEIIPIAMGDITLDRREVLGEAVE